MFGQHAPAYRSAHQLQASSPRPHNLAFHNALAEGATRGDILVQHTISDPPSFWNAADPTSLAPKAKLHHTFATPDGTRASCVWKADTVEGLRNLLDPVVVRFSRNEYFAVETREGFVFPSRVPRTAAAGGTGKR